MVLINLSYLPYLKQLEKSQFYTRKEIEKIQTKKLKYLLDHAYNKIPYFNNIFKFNDLKPSDIRTIDDLEKIPMQKRKTIKNNLSELFSESSKKGKIMKDFTSGSTTGERLKIFRDQECINQSIAAEIRSYYWYNINYLHEKFYYLIGADYDIEWEKKLGKKLKFLFSNTIKLSPIQLRTNAFENFLSKIEKYNRRVIYGTPTGICRMIKILNERDKKINIDVVISTDSLLLKQQRKFIKDFFNCDVYEVYGTSEVWSVAFECPQHNGYHLTSENVIMEVVDDNGQRANNAEKGHILLTDLSNFVMPFIRYDIGDIGILSDETCHCGRNLHLIKPVYDQLVYRDSQYIVSLDNKKIFLPELSFIVDDFNKVSNFQIIQQKTKDINLIIVKEKNYDKEYEDYIKSKLLEKLGNVSVFIDYVKDIQPDYNGKHKYLIR